MKDKRKTNAAERVAKIGTTDANRHSQMDIFHQNGIIAALDTMHEPKKVAIGLYVLEIRTLLGKV